MNVYIVWFDSHLLGTVFHGVYESEELAKEEVDKMKEKRPGMFYWADSMPMNSNVEE